jgi:hypothetical protein
LSVAAGAGDDTPEGGLGEDLSRSDVRLVARAVRQRWPIPDQVRARLVKNLALIVQESEDERAVVAAAKVLVAADVLNLEQEKRDLKLPDLHVHHHQGSVALQAPAPEFVAEVLQHLAAHAPDSLGGRCGPGPLDALEAPLEPAPAHGKAARVPQP